MVAAGPQNTTLPNVTFPSTQAVYGNVTFSATNPGAPPSPGNTTGAPGNDSAAAMPPFPVVGGVYSQVRTSHPSHLFPCTSDFLLLSSQSPEGLPRCTECPHRHGIHR